ncbi:hypothetical protein [uncultured Pseudoteredinibacter sp.]|uniref:hypothetical protein n=1 Tax=uncultured Pseudoteredinibacter sp. TaxID=1641701 RepID=UPI00260862F9|nr:hypothetical protein [uncultured Pseudoteredinibacter sp.]
MSDNKHTQPKFELDQEQNEQKVQSPKSLDDKVLAYAKQKAEAHKLAASQNKLAFVKPWFIGAGSLAVMLIAVLLLPNLEEHSMDSSAIELGVAEETASLPVTRRAFEADTSVSELEEVVVQEPLIKEALVQEPFIEEVVVEEVIVDEASAGAYAAMDEPSSTLSKPTESTMRAKRISKPMAKPQDPQQIAADHSEKESKQQALQEIVATASRVSEPDIQLVEKYQSELESLEELYRKDKLKAQERYKKLRVKEPLLPEHIEDAFDLLK